MSYSMSRAIETFGMLSRSWRANAVHREMARSRRMLGFPDCRTNAHTRNDHRRRLHWFDLSALALLGLNLWFVIKY
jgi:hypothetical protein